MVFVQAFIFSPKDVYKRASTESRAAHPGSRSLLHCSASPSTVPPATICGLQSAGADALGSLLGGLR